MPENEVKNEYLEKVKVEQEKLEQDLKAGRLSSLSPEIYQSIGDFAVGEPSVRRSRRPPPVTENLSHAVEVRIVGFWRWRTVIVPPNALVVHTRLGFKDPINIGLGISFKFDPYTDSFLVVPSTMQTILINAYSICRELQGLLLQGYVQWIIADFSVAYKKLDFSDAVDPMRLVNIQLREQAEAAIKDKVATMGINEVLSDKQPIINELTSRLRQVAEGEGDSDKGLGLRIVTVQIKEAVVSSARVWENLQKPFRADRAREARLAELSSESAIKAHELEQEKKRTFAELESQSEIAKIRSTKESEEFDREQSEIVRRSKTEQEVLREILIDKNQTSKKEQEGKREIEEALLGNNLSVSKARLESKHQELIKGWELRVSQMAKEAEIALALSNLEKIRHEKDSELAGLKLGTELARKEMIAKAELAQKSEDLMHSNRQTQTEIGFETERQKIKNDVSLNHLQSTLVETLPQIVANFPKPNELRTISLGNSPGFPDTQSLSSLFAQFMALLDTFRGKTDLKPENPKPKTAKT